MHRPGCLVLASSLFASALFASALFACTHPGAVPTAPRVAVTPAVAATPAVRELDVDMAEGFHLHVRIVGDPLAGPPLVLMPGGPGLSHEYLADLERLATSTRAVVSFDPRGSGRSTAPPTAAWTLADFARDIEAVRVAVGAPRIQLVGHSYSGVYAMAYALAFTDHLATMILVDSIPARASDMDPAMERFFERKDALAERGVVPRQFPGYDRDCKDAVLTWAPVWYADPARFSIDQFATTTCTNVDSPTMNGVGDYDMTIGLARLRIPTLVIAPAGTPFGAGMAEGVAAALPHAARKVILPDCGHIPWFECPDAFFDAMSTFLDDPVANPVRAP